MDVNVIQIGVALGEDLAVVAIKPGVDGVLIENCILNFKF